MAAPLTDAERARRRQLYDDGLSDYQIADLLGVTRGAVCSWRGRNDLSPNNPPPGSRSLEERFWEKVDKQGPEECWEWQAATHRHGYGAFGVGGRDGKMARAHRISYKLHKGPIPDGCYVLHHCDNPPCVNPDHLYVGTQTDNMQDAVERDRGVGSPGMPGETHPQAKVTEADVREMRQRYEEEPVSQYDLADQYGLTQSTVSDILRREIWDHVD